MTELEHLQAGIGSNLLILTMNVDENFQIPSELEVSSFPALALYRNGEFVKFIGGLGKKEEIRKEVERGLCR
jgi:thioredoxin-like negative regulator of GroEL